MGSSSSSSLSPTLLVPCPGSSAVLCTKGTNERTNERTKKDFTIYDGGDEQRTSASERESERASEEELKVSHNTTKVKDGFPQCGPTSVSDIGSLLGYVALQVANWTLPQCFRKLYYFRWKDVASHPVPINFALLSIGHWQRKYCSKSHIFLWWILAL